MRRGGGTAGSLRAEAGGGLKGGGGYEAEGAGRGSRAVPSERVVGRSGREFVSGSGRDIQRVNSLFTAVRDNARARRQAWVLTRAQAASCGDLGEGGGGESTARVGERADKMSPLAFGAPFEKFQARPALRQSPSALCSSSLRHSSSFYHLLFLRRHLARRPLFSFNLKPFSWKFSTSAGQRAV